MVGQDHYNNKNRYMVTSVTLFLQPKRNHGIITLEQQQGRKSKRIKESKTTWTQQEEQ